MEGLKQLEIEHWAKTVRGMARLTDDELPTGPEIAVRVLGAENVRLSTCDVGARLEGRTIIVPKNHQDISHAFAHELGELVLRDRAMFRGAHEEKEEAANAIGAAILAPPTTTLRAVQHFRRHLALIARAFGISHTSAHLRILEVLGEEGAVITNNHSNVMARNASAVAWGPEIAALVLSDKASLGRTDARPGLVKTSLRGKRFERGRYAVVIASA